MTYRCLTVRFDGDMRKEVLDPLWRTSVVFNINSVV